FKIFSGHYCPATPAAAPAPAPEAPKAAPKAPERDLNWGTISPAPAPTSAPEIQTEAPNIIDIDSINKYNEILGKNKPTLIILGASWCKPCKIFEKELLDSNTIPTKQLEIGHITYDWEIPIGGNKLKAKARAKLELARKLFDKMKIPERELIPQAYITLDRGKTFIPFIARDKNGIDNELRNYIRSF
ncbi:MAG: hypothetical protein WC806_01855, partial [Candidatus Gracilibacteria bacterium]